MSYPDVWPASPHPTRPLCSASIILGTSPCTRGAALRARLPSCQLRTTSVTSLRRTERRCSSITGSDQRAVRPLTPRMPERELELAAPYCERRTHVGSVESVPKSLGTADTKRCTAASALRATDRTRERPYARRALFTTLVAPTSYARQHRCQLAATPTSLRLSSKFARGIPFVGRLWARESGPIH